MNQSTQPHEDEHGTDGRVETIRAKSYAGSEFSKNTVVVYVNGIATSIDQEKTTALTFANELHHDVVIIHAETRGKGPDLVTAAEEKFGASQRPPEMAVEKEILKQLDGNHLRVPLHFAAHSRGALIVQRGLESVVQTLEARGMNASEIEGVLTASRLKRSVVLRSACRTASAV